MSEYMIQAVSTKTPREWSFADKKTGDKIAMVTYKVMLEAESDPIDLNRKPNNPPKVGEILTGTIEEGDFGKKFKPERKPFGGGGGYQRDDAAIQSQWSISQSIVILTHDNSKVDLSDVEDLAKILFSMIDRVKNSKTETTKEPEFVKPADVDATTGHYPEGFDSDEPVSIEDIPF